MNNTTHRIIDIHAHIVPCVDDGPNFMDTAVQMLHTGYVQGVRDVFCTSHSWGDCKDYQKNFIALQKRVADSGIDIHLHQGCEIDCSTEDVRSIVHSVKSGRYHMLGDSDYVLLEFDRYTEKDNLLAAIRQYIELRNNHIVIAHIERLYCLYEDDAIIDLLQSLGCLFQLNAYSLVEETKESTRNFARRMVEQHRITFLGSDAHRMDHRPPNMASGVEYIHQHCSPDYAKSVCYKNAEQILLRGRMKK
jgi:protein-tyrosine phosphatase